MDDSRLARAVDRFLAAQGGDDKHEWESAYEDLHAAREAVEFGPSEVSAVLEMAGMGVRVRVMDRTTGIPGDEDADRSALLMLEPIGCGLDGEEPGVYYLIPD